MDHDLNTKMANYEVTARARADQHRAAAAEVRGRPATGWDEQDRATEIEARGHDTEAKKWGDRADHARQGKVLVHDDDVRHQFAHQDLISDAESQHRAVHVPDARGGSYGPGTPGTPGDPNG